MSLNDTTGAFLSPVLHIMHTSLSPIGHFHRKLAADFIRCKVDDGNRCCLGLFRISTLNGFDESLVRTDGNLPSPGLFTEHWMRGR